MTSGRFRSSVRLVSTHAVRKTVGSLLLAVPALAGATNGYFAHGYGVKAEGLAGAGIAFAQDGLAAATNPAGIAFVGNRADLGLNWFAPSRSARIEGNAFGPDARYDGDGKKNFFIPEAGYVRHLSQAATLGVAVYGNGGMNTEYKNNPYARFGATGTAGVNLEQLFIAPSIAYQPNPDHAFGLAIPLAYQRFSAQGIAPFAGFSAAPGQVSNQGTDSSTGVGARLGWTGRITPGVTLGITWASKVRTGKFDKYQGLFADGGSFDIPENYGIGIAVQATPALTLVADVQEIKYGGIKPIANPLSRLFAGQALGSPNGPGFGWRDITVWKLGAAYALRPDVVVRAGYSHAGQPIPADQTFFNILAPGVVQDHLTLGATWATGSGELSAFYGHAFNKTVNGRNSIPSGFPPGGFGGGNAHISLKENIVGVAYGWKL